MFVKDNKNPYAEKSGFHRKDGKATTTTPGNDQISTFQPAHLSQCFSFIQKIGYVS